MMFYDISSLQTIFFVSLTTFEQENEVFRPLLICFCVLCTLEQGTEAINKVQSSIA